MAEDAKVSSTPQTTEAKPPKKRRRGLKAALLVFGVFLVLIVGGVIYLHSSHAFMHVLMPILADRVDGTVEAESGSVSLFGRMSVKGFHFSGPDEAFSLRANSMMASANPWSFIFGDNPRIHRIEIIDPEVIVRTEAEPDEEDEEEEEEAPGEPSRIIPFAIGELLVQSLLLEYYKGDQKEFTLTEGDVAIKDLAPGQSGSVSVKTNFAVAPEDENRRRSGNFAYDLALAQSDDGTEITWDGKGATQVREGLAGADGAGALENFASTLKGTYSDKRALQTTGQIAAEQGGQNVGTIAVDLNWKDNADQPDDMNSTVKLTDIRSEFLNPIVGLFGPTQFDSAQFDGTVSVKSAGDVYQFDSTLTGQNVSVRANKGDEPTPPLDIESVQSGQVKQDGSRVTIAQAQLRVEQGGQPKIAAGLDKPMVLAMGDEEVPVRDSAAPEEAHFNLRISDLSVENLRPWVAMTNPEALDQVRRGSLNGDLVISVVNQGERISINGNTQLSNLVLQNEGEEESRGPFLIQNESNVQISDMKEIRIENAQSRITLDGEPMGVLTTSGDVNTETGNINLAVDATAGNLGRMLSQLGVQVSEAIALSGGALDGETRLVRENNDSPLQIAGNVNLQNLTLRSDDGQLQRSADLRYNVELNPEMSLARVEQFALALQDGGEPAGQFTVQGQWPLSDETDAGAQAQITLAQFDAKPWMNLFGVNPQAEPAPGEEEPALAVEAGLIEGQFTVAQADARSPMALAGNLGVQNIVFTSPEDRTLERSATLKFDVTIDADRTVAQFDELVLALAEPDGTPAGTLSATGRWPLQQEEQAQPEPGRVAQRPDGRAEVRLAEFNGEPWVRLMGWAEGQDIGSLPIEAEETITIDSTGKNLTFEGVERIGPVRLASGDEAPEDVTMTIQNKFQKIDEDLRGIVVDLNSNRGGGRIDKARIEGSGSLGERPSFQLTGAIESLALDVYTSPFESEETEGAEGEPAPVAPETQTEPTIADEPVTEAAPIDLDLNLKIGAIGYKGALLQGGALIVNANKELLQASLQPATLNNGPIQGEFNRRVVDGVQQIQWSASGSAIPTAPVIGAFSPENANALEGMLEFNTTGLGTGTGEQLEQSMEGEAAFAVTEGKFGEVKLLSYIADVTGVDAFNQMFFNQFNGSFRIDEGWADIQEMTVAGPVAQLVADGKIGLDGALDVYVNPRVGPTIAERVPKEKYTQAFLGVVEGFTVLPVAVTVRGTTDDPSYGVRPTTPEVLKEVGGLFKGIVGGITGTAQDATESAPVEAIKETIGGAIRGLTGQEKKQEENMPEEGAPAQPTPAPEPTPPPTEPQATPRSGDALKDAIGRGIRGLTDRTKKQEEPPQD